MGISKAKAGMPQSSLKLCLTARRAVPQILFVGSQKEWRRGLRSPRWRRTDLHISKELSEEATIPKEPSEQGKTVQLSKLCLREVPRKVQKLLPGKCQQSKIVGSLGFWILGVSVDLKYKMLGRSKPRDLLALPPICSVNQSRGNLLSSSVFPLNCWSPVLWCSRSVSNRLCLVPKNKSSSDSSPSSPFCCQVWVLGGFWGGSRER